MIWEKLSQVIFQHYPNGNTKALVTAFTKGAKSAGHEVVECKVGSMNIKGCLACEYCHTNALFHDGEYITNEQMNDKKFLKLVKA